MHRPLFIAAFVLLLASGPFSARLSAQHGGGHASAGGHGGGMGSHGGFGGGGHAFGGTHSFSGTHSSGFAARSATRGFASHSSTRAFASRPSFSSRASSLRTSRGRGHSGVGVRIRTYGYGNGYYGYGRGAYGYPWWYGGLYDPYWWWDSDSSGPVEQYPGPQYDNGLANEMNEQGMTEPGDQDVYARRAPPPPRQEERTEAVPATVLVFRDQHKQEVQNYAIVGQTLWSFGKQRTEKIPLSDLDIPATMKANDERGVDFRLPGAHEGQ